MGIPPKKTGAIEQLSSQRVAGWYPAVLMCHIASPAKFPVVTRAPYSFAVRQFKDTSVVRLPRKRSAAQEKAGMARGPPTS